MKLKNILEKYYDREQNVQLSSFFDGGWTVKIGDELNGFSNIAECETIDEVIEFLVEWLELNYKLPASKEGDL